MLRSIVSVALMLLVVSNAWSIGFESFGNEPISNGNYKSWPNVMPLVNDAHRVYHCWVNGDEVFYFAGDAVALNAALKRFAAINAEKLTIVLRPAPGKGTSLNEDRVFEFNWKLHLLDGVAKVMSREDLGVNIWDPTPYLHVFVGDALELGRIEIPQGVELLEIADLKTRYAKCLTSSDRTVRGWCCGHIAALDPYDAESMRQIASKLEDDDDWVKLNAVSALTPFISNSDDVIGRLKSMKTENRKLQEQIAKTIEALQEFEPDEAARTKYQESLASIHAFVVSQRQGR